LGTNAAAVKMSPKFAGIFALLETIESDYQRLEADTTTQEKEKADAFRE
jgi:hypothetical protein